MTSIDFHADDFAISRKASSDVLDLCCAGKLDSISIIPNMSCFSACIEEYKKRAVMFPSHVLISIHLNFMEGHCVAPIQSVQDLVDSNGCFKVSWLQLFAISFLRKKRNTLRKQLAIEIGAQTEALLKTGIITAPLRFDSHQHTHLIPVVRDALFDAIKKNHYEVSFIRNSQEPVSVYAKNLSLFPSFGLANILKCVLLNVLSFSLKKRLRSIDVSIPRLCGVLMSGFMNERRLRQLCADLCTFSKNTGCTLEVLFHPGTVELREINAEYCKKGFVQFHLSPNRHKEYISIRHLYILYHSNFDN